jgi:hypothetical protein
MDMGNLEYWPCMPCQTYTSKSFEGGLGLSKLLYCLELQSLDSSWNDISLNFGGTGVSKAYLEKSAVFLKKVSNDGPQIVVGIDSRLGLSSSSQSSCYVVPLSFHHCKQHAFPPILSSS